MNDVIYTDFAKAFDKCDHGIIAHKLKKFGIAGKIGRWIYYFLSHRYQRVVVHNSKSTPSKVKSSVPQGTVLAPLLFLILISDIDNDVAHSQVFNWAEENSMDFNEEKFQLFRYGANKDINGQRNYLAPSNVTIPHNLQVMLKTLGLLCWTT